MPLPNHLTSEEAHEAGTESTKGFMRFGTLEEHISKAGNVAAQPKHIEDIVFPLRNSITKGTSLSLVAQEDGSFKWTPIGSGIPVGTISWILAETPPVGYLALSNDNGLLIRSAFPGLWEEAQRSGLLRTEAEWQAEVTANGSVGYYSSGNNSTTFRVPLLRKVFVRAPGGTQTVGMYQGDAIRNITGNVRYGTNAGLCPPGSEVTGPFKMGASRSAVVQNVVATGYDLAFDASLTVPTAEENRPVTVVLLPLMKAFDTIIPPSDLILADAFQQLVEINNRVNSPAHVKELAGTRLWVSAEYTPAGGTLTQSVHGLTIDVNKATAEVRVISKVNALGYSIGDEVQVCLFGTGTTYLMSPKARLTATTVEVTTATAGLSVMHRTASTMSNSVSGADYKYKFFIRY